MQRAVLALVPLPDIVLVDAFRIPDLPMAQRGVLHGDRRCAAIAAASIVAKVTRDREMVALHSQYPRYGFDRHKGYATADHLDAVARFGYSDAHRRSFRPRRCLIRLTDSWPSIVLRSFARPKNSCGRESLIRRSRNTAASSRTSRATGTPRICSAISICVPGRSTGPSSSSRASPTASASRAFSPKAGRSLQEDPQDPAPREHALLQAAEIAAAQELFADARAYLNTVAERRRSRGDTNGVAEITIRLAALDPSDYDARLAGARAQVEIRNIPAAISGLKLVASELTEQGRLDEALAALREAARLAPADVDVKGSLARILADQSDQESTDEATRLTIELSEAAAARGDWAGAVSVLQQSLKVSPDDLVVLSRLVEVSVDGGLHDVATVAQSQMADAYLKAGSAVEARFIAEDLVARHPGDATHIDRLRRALKMMGEADPEALIAARVSGLEPLGSDLQQGSPTADPDPVAGEQPSELAKSRSPATTSEADLSGALKSVEPGQVPATGVIPRPDAQATPSKDLDEIFAEMRNEAARSFVTNDPEQELATGLAFYQAGQLELAVPRLEAASRASAHRFTAAATLGRIFLERGEAWHAIEWLERAAEVPAPTPAEGHRLLYELADVLEGVGEVARALAICLELRADAGDIPGRVDTRRPARTGPGERVVLCCGACCLWHSSSRLVCC